MAKKINLSIIIVNFNTLDFTRRCLETIRKSDLDKGMYEILIVDNASKNGEADKLEKEFTSVTLIRNKENTGFAAANNKAIRQAGGEYILLLNPDTEVQPATLPAMLTYMSDNPSVGIATCRVEYPDGALDDACHRGFPTPWNALCHFSGLSTLFPHSSFFNGYHLGYKDLHKTHEIDSCVGAFMMIRREAGEQCGWLDEDYFWYGEDIDFCFRVKKAGWKIMFVPDVKIVHYKGVASGIKKHSRHLSQADQEIKKRATKARFDVMRIFYRKHYAHRYPALLKSAVLMGISLKEHIALERLGD